MFACDDFGYVPDMITCAKGMTSGYSPIGAMIANERLFEPFNDGTTMFPHGYTFGGHPVSAAVALANLDIFEREGLNDRVKRQAPALRATLEKLYDLPIVGDVRGEGYFYGIELVKDKATKQTFDADEKRALLSRVSAGLFEAGLYCRTDDRGDSVDPARAPADQRPSRVRHHRSDPAQCADEARESACDQTADRPDPVAAAAVAPAARTRPDGDAARRPDPRQRPRGCRRRRRRQHLDRCRGRPDHPHPPRRQLRAGGHRHRRATAGPGGRARRPSADLRQPPRSAALRPRHRGDGDIGRRGGRASADILLQRRRIIRRHNLFHRIDEPLPLRVLQRLGDRGSPDRVAVPA